MPRFMLLSSIRKRDIVCRCMQKILPPIYSVLHTGTSLMLAAACTHKQPVNHPPIKSKFRSLSFRHCTEFIGVTYTHTRTYDAHTSTCMLDVYKFVNDVNCIQQLRINRSFNRPQRPISIEILQ